MTTFLAADLPAPEIAVFLTELRRREASEHTIAAYCRDLVEFAGWFTEHLGLMITRSSATGPSLTR